MRNDIRNFSNEQTGHFTKYLINSKNTPKCCKLYVDFNKKKKKSLLSLLDQSNFNKKINDYIEILLRKGWEYFNLIIYLSFNYFLYSLLFVP